MSTTIARLEVERSECQQALQRVSAEAKGLQVKGHELQAEVARLRDEAKCANEALLEAEKTSGLENMALKLAITKERSKLQLSLEQTSHELTSKWLDGKEAFIDLLARIYSRVSTKS